MFKKFKERSQQLELLDAPDIPKQLLFQNLRELDSINKKLGGHSVTISGIKKLLADKNKSYNIIDIGCGGGDAMIAIANYARINNFKINIVGVDYNADVIEFAKKTCEPYSEISLVVADYNAFLNSNTERDIIHCSLFCHHLKNDELIELLKLMKNKAKTGIVINDLQRHPVAYYSIYILTRIFKGSSLVKNDAPLSVLRGFRKKELEILLHNSGIKNCAIKWKWAFRFLVVYSKRI